MPSAGYPIIPPVNWIGKQAHPTKTKIRQIESDHIMAETPVAVSNQYLSSGNSVDYAARSPK